MAQSSFLRKHVLEFDIDYYLNPVIPRQRLYLLPNFVSHWFGYRSPSSKPQPRLPNIGAWISAFVGGFIGIAIITHVFAHLPPLGGHQVPVVVASLGAAAVLEYNVIESPLSQPRNLILGHLLSAVVGVAITKAFEHLPQARFDELRWLAGSISVGLASAVMSATKTVHPPAGAAALLASTSPDITALGWWYLLLVLLAASLMCASALVVNNLTRRWPLYWWTPADLSKKPATKEARDNDIESHSNSDLDTSSTHKWESTHVEDTEAASESEVTVGENDQSHGGHPHALISEHILITPDQIRLPTWWVANDWEKEVLEILRDNLHHKRNEKPS